MPPALSIIIPVYNASPFIGECLDSILLQESISFEIICVDDGSTDDSVDKTQLYQNKYNNIHLFQQKNAGPGVARNTGLAHAQGEYVWFVDADDIIFLHSFLLLYTVAQKHNADIVCFQTITTKHRNTSYVMNPTVEPQKLSTAEALIFEPSAPWARIYKRDFLISHSCAFPPYYFAEDLAEVYRLFATANCIYKIETEIYAYYDNSTSVSKTHLLTKQNKIDFIEILRLLQKQIIVHHLYKYEFEYILYNHANAYINNLKNTLPIDTETISQIQKILDSIDVAHNLYLRFEKNAQRYYVTSASWKITKPFRMITKCIRQLRNKYL